MQLLKTISLWLFAPPAGLLLYDIIYNWFVKATFQLEKLKFWWNKLSPTTLQPFKSFLGSVTSVSAAEKIFNMPAGLILFVPPLFLYLLYRIIFLLQGGKQGGYKSRH